MVSRLKDEGSPAAPHKRAFLPRRHDQRGSAQLLNLICRQFCDKTREAGDQGSRRALPILIALHPCLRCAVGSASHDGIAFCDAPGRLDLIGVFWGRGEMNYIFNSGAHHVSWTVGCFRFRSLLAARIQRASHGRPRRNDARLRVHVKAPTTRKVPPPLVQAR